MKARTAALLLLLALAGSALCVADAVSGAASSDLARQHRRNVLQEQAAATTGGGDGKASGANANTGGAAADGQDDEDDDGPVELPQARTATPTKPQATSPPAVTQTPGSGPKQNVKIVAVAPGAVVTNNDDIDKDGKCAAEVAKSCADVEQGEGRLAECLGSLIAVNENPEVGEGQEAPTPVSDACREEVYQYRIARNSNINANLPLAKACKADVEKLCNSTWFAGYTSGAIIACLRENKDLLSKNCAKELTKVQQDGADDIRSDPALWDACKEEAANYCKDVKFGGGRVQACLRDNRMKLSWGCDEQLFRQEIENADDIRLSVRLYAKCMPDKRKFCKDVEPGHARTKDCLEAHRMDLSEACRGEVDAMIERRSKDFRLDTKLKDACAAEISNMCTVFDDMDTLDTFDTNVMNCLQDYSNEIQTSECKRQVKKYMMLASQDIRFDVTLAEACYEDRQKFCKAVPAGSARVIRCLSKKRELLSPVCRVTLFDEEVRFSENIDFQYPMKEACASELQRFCKDVPHGNARAIRCLQDNKGEKDFGQACRDEVKTYEAEISKDYRLNFRLAANCANDISSLCHNLCSASSTDGSVCGGKVLRCLTDKMDEIKVEACKAEVFYYQKMEVENFQNDIILAEACRTDVEQFCKNVEPGEGRVHQCLRDNRKKLSEMCRKEEMLLEQKEMANIELAGGLLRSCKTERQLFCREVRAGSARVFRCLAENMNDPDFSVKCKDQIITKLQRRQANWKLDPPLRKACKGDVSALCMEEDRRNSEEGLVYKCLIKNVASISAGCQRELGRAVHMALFIWQPEALLTADCDSDIREHCLKTRPNMVDRPGAIGSCLARILERQDSASSPTGLRRILVEGKPSDKDKDVETPTPGTSKAATDPADTAVADAVAGAISGGRMGGAGEDAGAEGGASAGPLAGGALAGARLSEKCYILADIAEPPNMRRAFDASLSFAALTTQISKIDAAVGNVGLINRNARTGQTEGISLTGWVAMLGMAALITLVSYGGYVLYRRMRGIPDNDGYTLVVKPQRK